MFKPFISREQSAERGENKSEEYHNRRIQRNRKMDGPIFRDIRRYRCQFCGIFRSKKTLITSHVLSEHKEEAEKQETETIKKEPKFHACEQCGAKFKKPAHLKQHMQSHSLERPFTCPVDDCSASYRRKDHLNRHLLCHNRKLFKCPIDNCGKKFTIQGNMKRHCKEFHEDHKPSSEKEGQKKYVCQNVGCGKEFRYESRLRKHEESHVKLDSVEVFCVDPSCMKPFSNAECLKAHILSCHQHVTCDVCGSKHLRKNIKRHLRTHVQNDHLPRKIKCCIDDCSRAFTTNSNLQQHINAAHLDVRPYVCSIPGCGKWFSFKHVRDKHEKSSCHTYVHGDLEDFDEQYMSRPRGGRKRKGPTIESLVRKRITLPNHSDPARSMGSDYLSWLLSSDNEDQ